jgi:hypothetical protein
MAFITLRSSRNTRSYYLIESYRDAAGKSRKRTLCYLGREQDGVDTVEKALAHWQAARIRSKRELRTATGQKREILRRRLEAIALRLDYLTAQVEKAAAAEAERRRHEQRIEAERLERQRIAEEASHWQAIEQLRRHPTEEHARVARRAFLTLAKRHHPDQGGTHDGFLRLKAAYDRALASWKWQAS